MFTFALSYYFRNTAIYMIFLVWIIFIVCLPFIFQVLEHVKSRITYKVMTSSKLIPVKTMQQFAKLEKGPYLQLGIILLFSLLWN